jgi:hypothetical protein
MMPGTQGSKGIVSWNVNFMNAYNIKNALSVHALMVFTILCFLVDEIIKLKVLASSIENTK